eukprot:6054536-Prymnesium_polylepis.2
MVRRVTWELLARLSHDWRPVDIVDQCREHSQQQDADHQHAGARAAAGAVGMVPVRRVVRELIDPLQVPPSRHHALKPRVAAAASSSHHATVLSLLHAGLPLQHRKSPAGRGATGRVEI